MLEGVFALEGQSLPEASPFLSMRSSAPLQWLRPVQRISTSRSTYGLRLDESTFGQAHLYRLVFSVPAQRELSGFAFLKNKCQFIVDVPVRSGIDGVGFNFKPVIPGN